MKLLLAAATEAEIQPLLDWLKDNPRKDIDVLITGIGMMAAAYSLGRYFAGNRPALAIQAGIAGTFRHDWPLGEAVLVDREILGDLGAEDPNGFLDLFDIGLWQPGMPPFTHKELINTLQTPPAAVQALPKARAVTVNTVSGRPESIARLEQRYQPDLESMEGAAFHYACLQENIPFLQLRTISNYVETRDKSKWNIPLAVGNLDACLRRLVEELNNTES
ncbi:futalosine hydrolase [Chitinophaga lutea]